MKKIFIISLVIIFAFGLAVLGGKSGEKFFPVIFSPDAAYEVKFKQAANKTYPDYHTAYINTPEAYGDLSGIKGALPVGGKIYGGIVSHHFFVAPKIAEFFAGLEDQEIGTIIIVGPNHFNFGEGDIQISRYPYITPWGILEPDSGIIENLLKNDFIKNEEVPFEKEHSISALAGFAKYYLPEAKIIPVILKRKTSAKEAEQLAQILNETLPKNSVVISSVDFSHHLNSIAADFHDEFSISVIKSFDYGRLDELEVDSPASLQVLLKYLEYRGSRKMAYESTNAAEFSANPDLADVTSYTFAYFSRGEADKENKISLLNFGDAMFDRGVEKNIQNGKDPFERIKGTDGNFLKGTDFVAVNLEGPISDTKVCQAKSINFEFLPEVAKLLRKNKINLANLANNHAYDCYVQGKNDTRKYLDISGIGYFGDSKADKSYIIKTAGGKKIAFIGIDDTLGISDLNDFYALTKNLKEENDYVVVNIHWGNEYAKDPSGKQITIAHALIDNGVDLIIGHHPHVIEPMEIYKDKAIFYSLGNFIFDQMAEETRRGVGVGVVLDKDKFDFYLFPYRIITDQPELLEYKEAKDFCDRFLGDNKTADPCRFEK